MANAIDKSTFSLPTILVTVFIWCLLIILNGPLNNGGGVAAWTNDVLPKLKLKYGKRHATRHITNYSICAEFVLKFVFYGEHFNY